MKTNRSIQPALLALGVALVSAGASAAGFTPIPLDPSSFNADPVVEASAPPSINDFVNVTPDQGTNKNGNTWYEIGYNTNIYSPSTYTNYYSGPLTGLPTHGSTFTAISNATHSFQMAPTYAGNCVIFVGHNLGSWTPIMGPGTFTLTTPAVYDHLSILNGTGNGANQIQATVNHQDGTSEQLQFSSPDWFGGPNANTAWRAGGLVGLNGGVNNTTGSGNPGTMWMSDITLADTTSPVTNIVFTWLWGSNNGHSPWGNGRTFIFAVSGSTDGGTTYSPITVTGYDHDGVFEANAPNTILSGSAALTGVLTNGYCNFTMDGGIYKVNYTWYEQGYYASYPNTGLPAAGSTFTSATEPAISYTMPSTYAGNCAVSLSSNILSDTITFASPTAAGSLAFLCGGGNGGFNLRVEIQFQGGGSETNWLIVPDWFNRTAPWSWVTFGQARPEARALRNTPDQVQNNWIPPQTSLDGQTLLPPGQPFSRDPRNGGASFPDLPIVRLFDAVIPVANSGTPISSINVVVTNTGSFGNTAAIFAVSGGAGTPPVLASTIPGQPSGQPFGQVTDSATGLTNATTGRAVANNIVLTKGWQGTNDISLIVSNTFPVGASYQWKRAPRGGGWRGRFLTDYDLSTFVNVSGPNIGGSTSNWLTISNATIADSADYLVVVTNNFGSTTSFVATVMVLTTNSSVFVGTGLGDTITKFSADNQVFNGEDVTKAIDQTQQKWLSSGLGGTDLTGAAVPTATVPFEGPIGYVATPVNGASVVNTIRFYCANDTQGRDPRDYLLEGSNDGSSWTTINGGQLLGTLMLPVGRDSGGTGNPLNPFTQPLTEVNFINATAYKSYRVTITNTMEPVATPLMQVAEIQLLGSLVPNPPVWVRQPVPSVTVFVGTSPTWGVEAAGYPTPRYQWYTNTVPVPGATGATFTMPNVQLANSGTTVSCVASNISGTIPSTSSTLNVIADPTQSYPSTVLADGPMAYWRLDEGPDDGLGNNGVVTHDYAGGHNGYYSNVTIAVSGYSPANDPNTAAQFGITTPNNYVENIDFVDFARGSNSVGATFSVEAWVFGDNQTVPGAIVAKGYNGNLNTGTGTGTEQFALDVIGTPSTFRFLVRDTTGQGHPALSWITPRIPNPAPAATWHHLVGVCDQPHGNVFLYVDGLLAASGTIPSNAGILSQPLPMTLGARESTAGANFDNEWTGIIDDVSMYPSALSAGQVYAHFLAGQRPLLISLEPTNILTANNVPVTFNSGAYGPSPISYQWYNSDGFNPTTPVVGQTASNMTFTTTPALDGTSYQLVATNVYGAVTSVVAQLNVASGSPSFIANLPAAQTFYLGHVIQLHVVPGGDAPFTYQWQKGGVNITDDYRTAGSTTDTLTIGYATNNTDSGTYTVIVTGATAPPGTSTADVITVTTNGSAFFTASANPADWSLNAGATLSGQTITLTVNAGNTARSAFLTAKQNIASFTARYVYQEVLPNPIGGGGADGVTFCIQNQAVTAVGGGGGALAYGTITPSVGLALNVYAPQTRGFAFFQNGTVTTPFISLLPNVGVGDNNDPIQVDVNYNGTVLAATFTDTVTAGTITTNITVNIPGIVGASTAWVGFTGADGGVFSQQTMSWSAPAASRIPLKFQKVGGNLVLSWPSSAGTYLMTSPSLSSPVWSYDGIDTFRVVGTNANVTVSPANTTEYFRLQLFP